MWRMLRGVQPVNPGYGIRGDQATLRERRTLLFNGLAIGEEFWKQAPERQHVVLLSGEAIDSDLPSGRGQGTA